MTTHIEADESVGTLNSAASDRIKLASLGARLMAQLIDGMIAFAIGFAAMFVAQLFGERALPGLWLIGGYLVYFLFSDGLPGGQSLGKRLGGIRVIHSETHAPCTYWQSFCRNATQILGVFDWIFILFKARQRAGDIFADTIVVVK
jgi:uncharacterized RDD family membrane protein YckC